MKFMILAYNPNHIHPAELVNLVVEIREQHRCPVYTIQHIDNDAEPIYCVQLVDTDYK